MNTMKKGERPGLDYLFDKQKEQEKKERETRAEKRYDELMLELSAIYDKAFEAAKNKKYAEYQQRINAPELSEIEKAAIQAELNDFQQNPEKYGVTRKNSPVVDEFDQRRALEIVEELKDKEGLSEEKDVDFVEAMRGYAERHAKKVEAQNKEVSEKGD